jgi:vesicle-fusing ATPase
MIPYPESSTNTMTVETKITAINGVHVDEANDSSLYYRLQPSSELNLTVSPSLKLITLTGLNSSLPSFSLDFSVKGVGGHKKQLASLLRDIFFSRAMPAEYAAEYGVNHTKGILLYGPPGTGKTLIGRVIGSMLTQEDKIKVVNGPELKNKYVGEGAKNLRDVFAEADAEWAAKGPESDTHVIIFDEIDALCPERGSRSGGTGSDEDMVSTLLTKLDGVKQQHNFVIIGTTNRPDLIDPALKRPGRLECHVEIGLPDEKDRLEILTIKIADMRKHELVDETVYLGYWAEQTKNYTGAELEELVKKAVHHAMGANFTLEPETGTLSFSKEIKDKSKLAKVAQEHFIKAFAEILPAFGTDKQFNQFKKTNFTLYSKTIESIVERFKGALALLNSREDMSNYQLLIAGPNGSGKTNLALYLAEQSNAKYVKVITAEKLLSYPLTKQFEYLDEQFANASRVEFSVLILEDLENLIGADAELRDYNNNLRLKLGSCLKALEQSNHKCVVIATTQKQSFIKRIKLGDTFSESFELSTISLEFNGLETTENLMSILCRSLGFEGKVLAPSHSDRDEPRKIELPIRELVYQIKKFLFERTRKEAFSLDEFYQFVNPVRAATSSNRLSYDELDEDLSRALGAGASSVFHRS